MSFVDKIQFINKTKLKIGDLKKSTDQVINLPALNSIFKEIFDKIDSNEVTIEFLNLSETELTLPTSPCLIGSSMVSCSSYCNIERKKDLVIVYSNEPTIIQKQINKLTKLASSGISYFLVVQSEEIKNAIHKKIFINQRNIISIEKTKSLTIDEIIKGVNKKFPIKLLSIAQKTFEINHLFEAIELQLNIHKKKIRAKSVLNQGEFLEVQNTGINKFGNQNGTLKQFVNKELNAVASELKKKNDLYNTIMRSEEGEINQFLKKYKGFKESEVSKIHSIKVSDGFIEVINEKLETLISDNISQDYEYIESTIEHVKNTVNKKLQELAIDPIVEDEEDAPKLVKTDLFKFITKPNSDLEKKATAKGAMSLLMELRTPMFMMMPLLMMGGILGMLLKSDDLGKVSETILNKNGYECIVVTDFPPSWGDDFDSNFRTFEERINKGLNDGIFKYEDVERITHTKIIGQRGKTTLKAKLESNSKNKTATILVETDRSQVLETLFSPNSSILHIKSRSGGMMIGYSALGRMASKIPNKKLVFSGLIILLIYYIRKKSASFKSEKNDTVSKDKKVLKENLKSDLFSYGDTVLNRWKSESNSYVKLIQVSLIAKMESILSAKANDHKIQILKKKNHTENRTKSFKDDQNTIKELLKTIQVLKLELGKFNRQMHV